jgi:intraflagellar transport protein 81
MRLKDQLHRLSEDKRTLLRRQDIATQGLENAKGTLESRLEVLRAELASLKSQSSPAGSDEKGIVFCQHQVVAANKRLDTKRRQLQDLQKARAEAEQQFQERQADGPIEIPSPAQFQQYVKNLKQKNENYRELQAQLSVFRKELAVVLRTEEIVNAQREQVRAETARIERQRGVGGFREAREQLEKVSATKADLDDMKGKTLEEMSAISKDIQRSIQARQAELKPLVNTLQEQRKKTTAVESRSVPAILRHQNAASECDSVCLGREEESKQLRADTVKCLASSLCSRQRLVHVNWTFSFSNHRTALKKRRRSITRKFKGFRSESADIGNCHREPRKTCLHSILPVYPFVNKCSRVN